MTAAKKNSRTRRGPAKEERGKSRLNLLIDADLKRFANSYAKKKHTSVTRLITDYFIALQEKETGLHVRSL